MIDREIVDPKGESEDISVLCGLVAWAVEHPDEYHGWDAETLAAALRWTFDGDPDDADEVARQLAEECGPEAITLLMGGRERVTLLQFYADRVRSACNAMKGAP